MKHNYVIICLDSMFETFLVVDEFEFLQIGSKETHWVRNNNLGFADLDCCFVGVELRVPHQLLQREQAHSQTLPFRRCFLF